MENSKIEWTDHIWNGWLLPEPFASLELALVADAIGFEVL